MKKYISLLLVAAIIMVLGMCAAGCSEASEEATPLKVALMVQGPANDDGWNQSAVDGLKLMEENLGAETSVSENLDLSDFEEYFVNYAKAGYDVVFGHGFSFGDAAMRVAPDYPDTYFIITSTDIYQEPNVLSVENDNAQQGFLCGAFAGLYTKTGTVGIVGGMEIPSIIAWLEGAKKGVEYVNPDVEVLANYTGNFEDSVAAKELARSMIDGGADVMLQNVDPAGVGVREICEEKGTTYVGTCLDQYPLVPDICATSGIADLSQSMLQVVERIVNGDVEIKSYKMGVAEDVVYLYDYQGKWVDLVSPEIKAQLEQITNDIKSGKIVVE